MNRLLMTILLCGVGPLGLATERHVPGQYRTIQEAIDASQDGDVVLSRG